VAKSCRNPECVNGLTPGVKISGKGKTGAPLFGQGGTQRKDPMHWAWVNCLVCNRQPADKDIEFKLIRRTPNEIAQRAQMASSKAEYKPKSNVGSQLGRVAATAGPLPDIRVNGAGNAEMMAKLDKINENMADLLEQIKELRIENKALKAENSKLKSGVNGAVATEASSS
jgi:hypothetical protein